MKRYNRQIDRKCACTLLPMMSERLIFTDQTDSKTVFIKIRNTFKSRYPCSKYSMLDNNCLHSKAFTPVNRHPLQSCRRREQTNGDAVDLHLALSLFCLSNYCITYVLHTNFVRVIFKQQCQLHDINYVLLCYCMDQKVLQQNFSKPQQINRSCSARYAAPFYSFSPLHSSCLCTSLSSSVMLYRQTLCAHSTSLQT